MKKLLNPTTYFFKQAQNPADLYRQEINNFISKLIDQDKCQLCKQDYDTIVNIPRIMIHCGHTFCSTCLIKFTMNHRVRCPMCLKLVKHLDDIERLPINHSIFAYIVQKEKKKSATKQHKIKDVQKYLFAEFQRVQKQAHLQENPQKIDPDSGLPFCVFHSDRVQHFYCQSHKNTGCRVCIEIGHSKSDCNVLDLYTVQNAQQYLNPMQGRINEPDVSDPFIVYPNKGKNMMFGLNNDEDDQDDDDDLVDDSDEDQNNARKSV